MAAVDGCGAQEEGVEFPRAPDENKGKYWVLC